MTKQNNQKIIEESTLNLKKDILKGLTLAKSDTSQNIRTVSKIVLVLVDPNKIE